MWWILKQKNIWFNSSSLIAHLTIINLDTQILCVNKEELSSNTSDEIKRLSAENSCILGGVNSLSEDVKHEIRNIMRVINTCIIDI